MLSGSCVCATPPIPLYPPTTICTTTQMQPSEGCAHAHLILEDTCPSMQPMRMQWETEDARVGWASHPSHLPSLGCTGCQHSILARAHTLPSCTALQTTLQGFANTRTALNSRSTQSKLWLSSNVMKVLVVKIFNLAFSWIFNSAITVHTSFHQYSILLIKFASVRGWSTALNMCTMEWYIFDVIPSWFEARVYLLNWTKHENFQLGPALTCTRRHFCIFLPCGHNYRCLHFCHSTQALLHFYPVVTQCAQHTWEPNNIVGCFRFSIRCECCTSEAR